MNYSTLLIEAHEQGIFVLSINRPDKLNALNTQVMKDLDQAIAELSTDTKVKAIIITGAGDKAFVAGADIAELATLNESTGQKLAQSGQAVFNRIARCPKPVIAVVEGYALGGGCELAMACHIRIASSKAVFGLPEVSLGLIPGYGGTQRLTRLVGQGRAMEMILTGNPVKADQALQSGLVNKVVEAGTALQEAKMMLETILKRAPLALTAAIKAILASQESPEEGYNLEAEYFGDLCGTKDFKMGTTAFLAKEKPDFTGS